MIVPLQDNKVRETARLVRRVFPIKGPDEWGFYWAWPRRNRPLVQRLMRLGGVSAIEDTWIDIDDSGNVRGTIGLYATPDDEHEARWVSWFCVHPRARGRGIGKALLDHLIGVVRQRSWRYLRLYTGSDPDEAKAQLLYESRGLRETRRVPMPFSRYEKIYRELDLSAGAYASPTESTQARS